MSNILNLSDPMRLARRAHGMKDPVSLMGRSMKLRSAAYDSRGDSKSALLHIADYLQGLSGGGLIDEPPRAA